MAIVEPSRAEIARLPTPLNAGEEQVLRALETLDDEWRVFVQPTLRMDHPDFVVAHPQFGVCAIEVKDWNPECYRVAEQGGIEVRDHRGWHRIRDAPRLQAHRYRSTIFEHFFAAPESGTQDWKTVRAVVILPQYTTKAARALLTGWELKEQELDIVVWGREALGELRDQMLTGYKNAWGMNLPAGAVDRLVRHLREAEFVADQRRPLLLSAAARNLARNPSGARIRRARGPAGSGKSLGLAARAATLAAEGRSVLVLSFNITLPHYLHDLAARHGRELGARISGITFVHFHGFCQRAREDGQAAGVAACMNAGGSDGRAGEEPGDPVEWLVTAAIAAYRAGVGPRFDAILVDEGQDFQARWWSFLREFVLIGEGEMLLVADTTQDLYGRAGWTTEATMSGCGFSGPWTELPGSYRMPPDLVPILAAFGEKFLADGAFDPPVVPGDHPMRREAAEPTLRGWTNVHAREDVGRALADSVLRVLLNRDFARADVVFLCEDHAHGLQASRFLGEAGEHVSHVFTAEDGDDRRRRKRRFWGGMDGVKGCTVHSFKGWEARVVVLCISASQQSRRLAYVALTRVKGAPGNIAAVVQVLNCDPELNDFKAEFERELGVAEVPALGGQRRLL